MSTYADMGIRSRAGPVLAIVASTGTLALLWAFRPSFAGLPRSLEEPLTATGLEDLGTLLAWLALACVALLVLVRALRSTARPRRQPVGARDRPGSRSREAERSRPAGPARHSRGQASSPRSSAFQEQVVLALSVPAPTQAAVEAEPRVEVAEEAPTISVSVLGPLQITGGKRRRRLRASARELIAYLALHRDGASRDQLLEALWPGEDPKRSEQRLWQSSSDVRRVLGSVITRERDRYSLDGRHVRLDVDELERLLASAGTADPERVQQVMERALALFTGEPLSGSDYAWAGGELRRLRAIHVDLLEQAGRGRLAAGEWRAALDAAERGLAIDVLNEGLWRLALEAESALGLREAVAERYEHLRVLLDERLGLEPARETRLLHRRLLAQH
jgi:DNA-binding SARP family transcriptional activator